MTAIDDNWYDMRLDSPLEADPAQVVEAPVIGASQLPVDQLYWEDFERLQWRILRDIEGLRSARIYGKRGQAQFGLDIVALDPFKDGVALQSKRYQKFSVADLKNAVVKFQDTQRPFDVTRFIIGVACEVKDTKVIESLAEYQEQLYPIELELWDKEEFSRLLRDRPEIVIEFFGEPTTKAFCRPYELQPTVVPSRDAVIVQEAISRTPEVTTGAASLFDSARELADEPERALDLISRGQELLIKSGFSAHAAQYEQDRSQILIKLDRAEEAARTVLDEIWRKLSLGRSGSAESSSRSLEQISKDAPGNQVVAELVKVAASALSLYLNPRGDVPSIKSLVLGEPEDRLQLAVLASETALANNQSRWLEQAVDYLTELTNLSNADHSLQIRLRIVIAEFTNEWGEILADARKLQLGTDYGALVTARYARNQALRQQFQEADALWNEASGGASLKKRWFDASTWVFSRRAFRTRWCIVARDNLLSMEISLSEMGPSESLLRRDEQAYVSALENFRNQKLRQAAIAGQRALRQAIASADWVGEEHARRLLGAIFAASDEPELAAYHLALGADVASIEGLAHSYPGIFIDVVDILDSPNYWTVGTAFRLLAAEADLIPDEVLGRVVDRILVELEYSDSDTYFDAIGFSTSRFLGAIKTLAGVANRLTERQAEKVLVYFENQPIVDSNQYRFHDEYEAITVAEIARNHSNLQARAVAHLAPLLARSQPARNGVTVGAIKEASATAREHLEILASAGSHWAQETLASYEDSDPSPEARRAAFSRLSSPLKHVPGVFTVGTNAIGDAALIQDMSVQDRKLAVTELLNRAIDRQVSTSDKKDYLIAASQLVNDFDSETRQSLFSAAMKTVRAPQTSLHDEFSSQFTHKLGQLRVTTADNNAQAEALFLAACLAESSEQELTIKNQVYLLLGTSDRTDYILAQTLQSLEHALDDDLGFLAGQSWALRAITAIRWVRLGNPEHLGRLLARDKDPRVRRALAESLAEVEPRPEQAEARKLLEIDPAYSVRSALKVVPSDENSSLV